MTPMEKAKAKQVAQEEEDDANIAAPERMLSEEDKRKKDEELAKLQAEEKKALATREKREDTRKKKRLPPLVKFVGPSWLKIVFLPPNLTEIQYAVHQCARFSDDPKHSHEVAAK